MAFPTSHCTVAAMALILIGIIAMNPQSTAAFPKIRPKPPGAPPPASTTTPMPASPGGIQQQASNMLDFIKYCALYMHASSPRFLKPNEKCCTSIAKVNIPLFCKVFFIPNTEKVFSPRKVARTAKSCNKPLPVNSWCGTYRVKQDPLSIEEEASISTN